MIHAEVNLCSLFKRGEAKLIACTTKPCTACMQMLCAYGVKEIFYREDYPASEADLIADLYSVHLVQMPALPRLEF
jgi:dCMP deaminase